jgi:hypothetical protein
MSRPRRERPSSSDISQDPARRHAASRRCSLLRLLGIVLITSPVTLTALAISPSPSASAASNCSPRPPVGVTTVPTNDGRLQVTITANINASTPTNAIEQIQFKHNGSANAVIEIQGQTGTGSWNIRLSPPVPTITFYVRPANSSLVGHLSRQ